MKTFRSISEHQTNKYLEAYGWDYTEELCKGYIGVQWLDQVILLLQRAVFAVRRPNTLVMATCLRSSRSAWGVEHCSFSAPLSHRSFPVPLLNLVGAYRITNGINYILIFFARKEKEK